ncbi:MAG: flagellar basal body P-ring formation protein FlgA [Pseudomonadaceae bacterium]|nr:flagellar basal body P-ring formation protein FlgA [Pseudomonadaceae bacterium]
MLRTAIVFALLLTTAAHAADVPETVRVPVPVAALQPGDKIDSRDLVMKEVPAGSVFASTIQDPSVLAAMQAKRPLPAGKPVNRLHVKPQSDVSRNGAVTLVFKRPGLELVGSGQALEDARVGDSVRVLNPNSRATLVGVVVAANTVEVQ